MKQFLTQEKNVFSTSVKTLRTYNDCEFFSHAFKELLCDLGIAHQSTCVYTPQQNGAAERNHRTILEVARSIRFQTAVPLRYWGVCITIYILNRLPSKVLGFMTPYEKLYLHPPNLSHLKVFGCLYYAVSPKVSDKFASRAISTVLMGYSASQKGYLLLDFHTHSFLVSRHMVFQENIFPFKTMKASLDPIFPILESVPPSRDVSTTTPSPLSTSTIDEAFVVTSPSMHEDITHSITMLDLTSTNILAPSRRSNKPTRPSLWLQDFVTKPETNTCMYLLANHIT